MTNNKARHLVLMLLDWKHEDSYVTDQINELGKSLNLSWPVFSTKKKEKGCF